MALQVWPDAVPYAPQRGPYSLDKRRQDADTTEMEDGPDRQRPTATADWSTHSYTVVMTRQQFDLLDQFLQVDCVKGSARFNIRAGRFDLPKPWPYRMAYIPKGQYSAKDHAINKVAVSFTIRILDW